MAGIYVHFPYCSSRCIYCDFYSRVRRDWTEYIDALGREMSLRNDGFAPRTLYFGGGTPSILPLHELQKTVHLLHGRYDLSQVEEFTIECNPDDISKEKAVGLRALGANRISMGVQSFFDEHLKWMKRRHSAEGAEKAFNTLRQAGFENISIDLIFGFSGLTLPQWNHSITAALTLLPEHISCYQMMGRHASDDEEMCRRQYALLQERLSDAGYLQYELSNFALEGRHSRHNSAYWAREAYIGLGAAAHSFDGERTRAWNISDIDKYAGYYCAESGHSSPEFQEILSDSEIEEERIMLGLRTSNGISSVLVEKKPAFNKLVEAGYIERVGSSVRIRKEHLFVSDWITTQLM